MTLIVAMLIYLASHIAIGEATSTPCAAECVVQK